MLNLTGIRLLGFDRSKSFFGDSFNFQNKDQITLEGSLTDLYNSSGVQGILQQLSGISTNSIDYQDLTVNGYYLGQAQINSVSYAPWIDVKVKSFTLNATVYQSGNLFNLNTGSTIYSGVQLTNTGFPAQLIENFDEWV